MTNLKKLEKKLQEKAFPKTKKVKQQVHMRLLKNKNVLAGQGKKDIWIGRMVWYKGEVYQVIKKEKEGRYTLINRTMKLRVEGVSPAQWMIYK